MQIEVTFTLPDDLVRDAQELGILEEQVINELLQAEVDRRVNDLVNEEIHAYRAEKRAKERPQQIQ